MERIQDRHQENPALTHYDDLGVYPSASDPEIREAYLGLVRLLHPDSPARAWSLKERRAAENEALRAAERSPQAGPPLVEV